MASINATDYLNDFYNRIADMCKEAVPKSIVVPDYTDVQTGGTWWVIKLKSDTRKHGNAHVTKRGIVYEVHFILGEAVSSQGTTRELLYTNIKNILFYFERQVNLTTTTSDSYAEIEGAITFDLIGEGMVSVLDGQVDYRGAAFNLSFNYTYRLARSM